MQPLQSHALAFECRQRRLTCSRCSRSQQLQSLYGPLLACVTASKSSYEAMVRQFSGSATDQCPSAADFRAAVRRDPHGPAACAYRQWVREVLLPLSAKAADLIIARADLLEGTSIEPTSSSRTSRRTR